MGDQNAAVAEIVRRGRDNQGQVRINMPIGVNTPAQHVDLMPGDYTVRIFLPNGDVLAESVTVGSASKSDERQVEFDILRAPHEWLSLDQVLGSVQSLPSEKRARTLDSWRSVAGTAEGIPENFVRRIDQAMVDFKAGYKSVNRAAAGMPPTGTCYATRLDPNRPIPEGRLPATTVVEWWMGMPTGDSVPLEVLHHDQVNAKLVSAMPRGLKGMDLLTGEHRAFARIRDPQGRMHHAVHPLGWRRVSRTMSGSPADAELLMTVVIDSAMRGKGDRGEAARWRCASRVTDVEVMAYLGFLHAGQAGAAEAMLMHAYDLLYEKQLNPVAAAAGAFGLLAFPESKDWNQRNWRRWVSNLFTMFPHLPDGAIAMAQLYLRQGAGGAPSDELDIETLRGHALEATRRGLPYLTYGIRLLSEIFVLLTSDDLQHDRKGPLIDQTADARRMVRALERLIVPGAFFTVLETGAAT